MDKIIDLHTHSCFSDGTLSPCELIKLAKESSLSAVALTDHDTVDGLTEAISSGAEYAVEVVPGIEFSISSEYGSLHIVGLYIDPKDIDFIDMVAFLREKRKDRNLIILEKLKALGLPLGPEELLTNPDGLVTRAHFAKAMVRKGYCSDISEAYSKYLSFGSPAFVPKETLTPEECIKLIHKAGGAAVLAHLNQIDYKNDGRLIKIVSSLKDMGLDGIEGYYHDYSDHFMRLCFEIADIFDLAISGGSDFHGQNKKNILGQVSSGTIPYSLLPVLRRRAERKEDILI